MSTQTETLPTSEAPPCWPPLAHIVKRENSPPKEGDLALCGAKLMGLDLDGGGAKKVCTKCVEIAKRMMSQ